jgi:hypothetical protein
MDVKHSLAVREEYTYTAFDDKDQRNIFGFYREEKAGQWRKLRNKELLYFYSLPDNIQARKSKRTIYVRQMERVQRLEILTKT